MKTTSNRTYYHKVQDQIIHYQYLILHNGEFRSFENRKNYLKTTTATMHGNKVRVFLCLHCIIVN
jgi:hypothetical protein